MGAAALTAIDSFRFVPAAAISVEEPARSPQCAVWFEDRPTGVHVRGAVLEAQFAVSGGAYVLLATDDCPYEEELHVYLLNPEFVLVEQLHLGYAYTPGILRDVRITVGNQLEFLFIGERRYRLSILDRPTYFWNPAAGVGEVVRCLFKRRLKLLL